MNEAKRTPGVGIDLGTSFTALSIIGSQGRPDVVKCVKADDSSVIPSVVAFTPPDASFKEGKVVVGPAARKNAMLFPRGFAYDSKRLIGCRLDSPQVQQLLRSRAWTFDVIADPSDKMACLHLVVNHKLRAVRPEEVASHLLRTLREAGATRLDLALESGKGKPVLTDAVIGVPATFSDAQRAATIEAGKMAGFSKIVLLMEPVAATLYHRSERPDDFKVLQNALMFDLGGGTLDVTVLRISNQEIKILAVDGDSALGGEDIDNLITEEAIKQLKQKHNIDVRSAVTESEKKKNDKFRLKLKEQCRLLKESLTTLFDAEFSEDLPSLDDSFHFVLSRINLEQLCKDLFSRITLVVMRTVQKAYLKPADISQVLLAGGCSLMPKVKEILSQQFGAQRVRLAPDVHHAIAHGCAIHCRTLGTADEVKVNTELRAVSGIANEPLNSMAPRSALVGPGQVAIEVRLLGPYVGKEMDARVIVNQKATLHDLKFAVLKHVNAGGKMNLFLYTSEYPVDCNGDDSKVALSNWGIPTATTPPFLFGVLCPVEFVLPPSPQQCTFDRNFFFDPAFDVIFKQSSAGWSCFFSTLYVVVDHLRQHQDVFHKFRALLRTELSFDPAVNALQDLVGMKLLSNLQILGLVEGLLAYFRRIIGPSVPDEILTEHTQSCFAILFQQSIKADPEAPYEVVSLSCCISGERLDQPVIVPGSQKVASRAHVEAELSTGASVIDGVVLKPGVKVSDFKPASQLSALLMAYPSKSTLSAHMPPRDRVLYGAIRGRPRIAGLDVETLQRTLRECLFLQPIPSNDIVGVSIVLVRDKQNRLVVYLGLKESGVDKLTILRPLTAAKETETLKLEDLAVHFVPPKKEDVQSKEELEMLKKRDPTEAIMIALDVSDSMNKPLMNFG